MLEHPRVGAVPPVATVIVAALAGLTSNLQTAYPTPEGAFAKFSVVEATEVEEAALETPPHAHCVVTDSPSKQSIRLMTVMIFVGLKSH